MSDYDGVITLAGQEFRYHIEWDNDLDDLGRYWIYIGDLEITDHVCEDFVLTILESVW